MKRIVLVTIAALLLGGCASTREGMVYRDGSWYAPASGGHGDYYTGVERRHDYAYDSPWAWNVGIVPYGGYCPVQYRYCTSFWSDAWYGGYYPYLFVYQPRHRPRHRHWPEQDASPMAGFNLRERSVRDPAEQRPTQGREPGSRAGSRRDDGGAPRPRRRVARGNTSPN